MPISPNREALPPPPDWDTFQRLIRDLYARVWNDPQTQLNGRTGQAQHGVDVYGQPANLGGRYGGIQCKRYTRTRLTKPIINSEISDAESFTPELAELYLATTECRDAKLQAVEREVRAVRQQQGKFAVYIKFWEDIWDELRKHDDLVVAYYSDYVGVFDPYTPSRQQLVALTTEHNQLRTGYQKSVEDSLDEHLKALRLEVDNGFAEAAQPKILALVERMESENNKVALNPSLVERIYLFAAGAFITNATPSSQQRAEALLNRARAVASTTTSSKRDILEALLLYESEGGQSALRRLATVLRCDHNWGKTKTTWDMRCRCNGQQ